MIQVRDLIEDLEKLPSDRLRLAVVSIDGKVASADSYELRRIEDGTHQLRIHGALVRAIVQEEEPLP